MKTYFTLLSILLFFVANAQFKYKWRQISGPIETNIVNPDSATTLVTGLNKEGVYGYEFSVTNEFGSGYDTMYVTVLPAIVLALPDESQRPPVVVRPPTPKRLEVRVITKGDKILAEIKSPRVQKLTCVLFNMLGQPLAKAEILVRTGTQVISLPKPQIPGVYVIRFIDYFEQKPLKVVIM